MFSTSQPNEWAEYGMVRCFVFFLFLVPCSLLVHVNISYDIVISKTKQDEDTAAMNHIIRNDK